MLVSRAGVRFSVSAARSVRFANTRIPCNDIHGVWGHGNHQNCLLYQALNVDNPLFGSDISSLLLRVPAGGKTAIMASVAPADCGKIAKSTSVNIFRK